MAIAPPLGFTFSKGMFQVLDREHGLARERLVDLVEVDVGLRDACELENAGDGVGGTDAHDTRGHTDGRSGDELADDREPEALCDGAAREQDGSGAVGYLRGVTCGQSVYGIKENRDGAYQHG